MLKKFREYILKTYCRNIVQHCRTLFFFFSFSYIALFSEVLKNIGRVTSIILFINNNEKQKILYNGSFITTKPPTKAQKWTALALGGAAISNRHTNTLVNSASYSRQFIDTNSVYIIYRQNFLWMYREPLRAITADSLKGQSTQ